MCTYMQSCQHKEGGHMQSKAMEMLDNLHKKPATGMGKKVSTVHTLYILVLCLSRRVGNGFGVKARYSPNPLFLKRFR